MNLVPRCNANIGEKNVHVKFFLFFFFQLLRNGVKPLPSWGPSEANKKFEYRDSGVTYRSDRSAFAKLMSSNISNMTTNTTLSDFPFSSSNALGNPDTV